MVERGTSHVMNQEGQVLVARKDNKAIYVASNKYTAESTFACRQAGKSTVQLYLCKYLYPPLPTTIDFGVFIYFSLHRQFG